MELRHLRYMLAVAEHRNFTRAAHAIHISQSTLSYQIRQLELEIGRDLFDRAGREVVLTSAGETLIGGVRRAFDELNTAIRDLKREEDGSCEYIRILVGARGCAQQVLAPEIAAQITPSDRIRPRIEEVTAAAMNSRLQEEGEAFDIVLGDIENLPANWRFEPLYREEIGLVVPPTHRLAGRKRMQMAELEGEPIALVMPPEPTRLVFDRALSQSQACPDIVAEFNRIESMLEMAMLRGAGAIVPRNPCTPLPGFHYVALENPVPMRSIGFLWREEYNPEPRVRRFVDRLRKRVRAFAANDYDFKIHPLIA